MSKHALPDSAYESRIGHVRRGVSRAVFDQWSGLIGDQMTYGGVLTRHAKSTKGQ